MSPSRSLLLIIKCGRCELLRCHSASPPHLQQAEAHTAAAGIMLCRSWMLLRAAGVCWRRNGRQPSPLLLLLLLLVVVVAARPDGEVVALAPCNGVRNLFQKQLRLACTRWQLDGGCCHRLAGGCCRCITLQYITCSTQTRSGKPQSGANERLIGGNQGSVCSS